MEAATSTRDAQHPVCRSNLQGSDEEISEGLHDAKYVLQGQLAWVFAEIIGKFFSLLFNGFKFFFQLSGGINAVLKHIKCTR